MRSRLVCRTFDWHVDSLTQGELPFPEACNPNHLCIHIHRRHHSAAVLGTRVAALEATRTCVSTNLLDCPCNINDVLITSHEREV